MKNKLLILTPIFVWILVGIYGIFYNPTYIDEAKYLIKGWLITTGQVGYYSTKEFFYQHMPGGLLWYGIGQRIFGPNLLIARIQSFLIGVLVMLFSYKLAGLINPKTKRNILSILGLAPVAILYYSSAVPQSLSTLSLILGFYWLYKNRSRLATASFALSFIIRENFLFTLAIYLLFLLIELRKNIKELIINFLITLAVLAIFFVPGWPGTINILKNFPGVSRLLPVNAAEKTVLGLNWMIQNYDSHLYVRAIKEFGVIYFSFFFVGLISLINGFKGKTLWLKDNRWRLLLVITGFNFLAHTWSAFNLTPRSIVAYLAYTFPLLAVIAAVLLQNKKIKFYYLLLMIALISLNFASIFQWPNKINTIKQLTLSANSLKPVVSQKQEIVWLTEPMSLYLAGKVSYYPLINHTNFYKPSNDTQTVRKLGFWNQEMMAEWLNEADLVVLDYNRLKIVSDNNLTQIIENKVNNNYTFIQTPENIWPENLSFFSK